jgi:peptidyl-tRNA hydrolase, PTH1 family
MIKLVVGLGNPGSEYTETRHNAGFWFVDSLARQNNCQFSSESRFHGEASRISSSGIDCRLLKPQTFMNDSGRSVQAMLDYFKIGIDEVLVAHDEIDLDSGIIRLKKGGGHGGHNGLRDIISQTGEKNFLRLRIGVGHPGSRDSVTPHVLGRAGREDQKLIDLAVEEAISIMPLLFDGKLQKAMNELHSDGK